FTEGTGTLLQKHDAAVKEIERTRKQLEQTVKAEHSSHKADNGSAAPRVESNFKKPAYLAAIKKAKQYIRAGAIFQLVISARFAAKPRAERLQIYRELRASTRSPYLFLLQPNDVAVVGSSPEMLVKVQGRDVFYRPIAGKRWRGKNEAEELRLEKEMMA